MEPAGFDLCSQLIFELCSFFNDISSFYSRLHHLGIIIQNKTPELTSKLSTFLLSFYMLSQPIIKIRPLHFLLIKKMVSLSKLILLCALIALTCSFREFKNDQERDTCLSLCSSPVSTCLNHDPACQKAYAYCISQPNFVSCLQSANGLRMQ